jgi:hypothetical protein
MLTDNRDNRDPQKIGEMLARRHELVGGRYSRLADQLPLYDIPNYDPGESVVTLTAKTYQAELMDRADRGDRYARSMLERGEPGDSDE